MDARFIQLEDVVAARYGDMFAKMAAFESRLWELQTKMYDLDPVFIYDKLS